MIPAADAVTTKLYQAIDPQQLHTLVESNWRRLAPAGDDEKFCLLPVRQRHAEMIARQLLLPAWGAAYVISLELPGHQLSAYPLETVGYEEHLEYRVPVSSMKKVSDSLLGAVQLVSVFRDQHSYSVPRGYRWSNRLLA